MQVLCFLAHTVVAGILKSTFDAALTRSLVTYNYDVSRRSGREELCRAGAYRMSNALADRQNMRVAPSSSEALKDLLGSVSG